MQLSKRQFGLLLLTVTVFTILLLFMISDHFQNSRSVSQRYKYFDKSHEKTDKSYNTTDKSYNTTGKSHNKTGNSYKKTIMTIQASTDVFGWIHRFKYSFDFKNCEYSNCVYKHNVIFTGKVSADIILVEFQSNLITRTKQLPKHRENQLWIAFGHESPVQPHHRWKSHLNNINGTMTYRRDSNLYFPWGETIPLKETDRRNAENYGKDKSKGAFAYVSHCSSVGYDRLGTMKELSKYIDVDIFGGCTGKRPCLKRNTECEAKKHKNYKFYLSFENSLCKDYISEKFWKTLFSPAYFVPVALGGLSVDEYTAIAPPDSFIHAYNFSSISQLGNYLRYLMENDDAYNKYHQWRENFDITFNGVPHTTSCKLCELANKPDLLRPFQNTKFADEWNNLSSCRSFGNDLLFNRIQ